MRDLQGLSFIEVAGFTFSAGGAERANRGRFPQSVICGRASKFYILGEIFSKRRKYGATLLARENYFSVFTAQAFRLGVWGKRPILAEKNLREDGWKEPQSNIAPFISPKKKAAATPKFFLKITEFL